jgi:hypothetical protein
LFLNDGARARFAGGIRPIDARVGIGLAVRKGISRPDISNPEALMRTLLAAAAKVTLLPESCAAEGASDEGKHCHRWFQVQSREESRQDLHAQQDRPAAHTVVELLQKRLTNAGSDPTLRGEVVLLRATRCARPDRLWRARKELNPL